MKVPRKHWRGARSSIPTHKFSPHEQRNLSSLLRRPSSSTRVVRLAPKLGVPQRDFFKFRPIPRHRATRYQSYIVIFGGPGTE